MSDLLPTSSPLTLVIDNSRAVTGALNAMRHATGPLREQYGLRFEYVLPTGSAGRAVLEADGYVVHELPFVEISRRKADLLLYLPMLLLNGWRLQQLARRRRAGLLHLNDFFNLAGHMARFWSLGRLQVITHVRFLPQTQVQVLARCWAWLAEKFSVRVLCVSQIVGRYFRPLPKVQVIYDPLPGQEKHPVPLVPAVRPDQTMRLLYLSNYIAGKGQNFALAAFAAAYAQQPRLRLHFAGGDMGMAKNQEYKQHLMAEAERLGLAGVISFGSFITDVEAAIKQADILLNFSESESFSLTCLDALFYGTPLIASDCGGPAELFEHGRSGLLVPNRDVPAMTAAIVRLAADPALRQQFAAAGRQYVRHKFRPEATIGQLAATYQAVLARQPR